MRVSCGTTAPRHRPSPANPGVLRPVEQHQPAYEPRAGHDLGLGREPKPGGRNEYRQCGRGAAGAGAGPASGAARRALARTAAQDVADYAVGPLHIGVGVLVLGRADDEARAQGRLMFASRAEPLTKTELL